MQFPQLQCLCATCSAPDKGPGNGAGRTGSLREPEGAGDWHQPVTAVGQAGESESQPGSSEVQPGKPECQPGHVALTEQWIEVQTAKGRGKGSSKWRRVQRGEVMNSTTDVGTVLNLGNVDQESDAVRGRSEVRVTSEVSIVTAYQEYSASDVLREHKEREREKGSFEGAPAGSNDGDSRKRKGGTKRKVKT